MKNSIFHNFENFEISELTGIRSLRFIRKIKEGIEQPPYSLVFLLFIESQNRERKIMPLLNDKKIKELNIKTETLKPFFEWKKPTSLEIKNACDSIGKSSIVGSLVGVSSSNIRKYIGGHKDIPYSVWALICYEAGIGVIWTKNTKKTL